MKTKITWGNLILGGALAFAVMLWLDARRSLGNSERRAGELTGLLQSGAYSFRQIEDGVAEQKRLNLEMSARQSRMFVEDQALRKEVKALQSMVRWASEVRFDTIRDTISEPWLVMVGDTGRALRLPWSYGYESKWLSFRQEIGADGVNEYSGIRVRDSVSVLAYVKRNPWYRPFARKEAVVRISHSNPYVHVSGMENVAITQPRGILQKRWFWGVMGAVAGGVVVARMR